MHSLEPIDLKITRLDDGTYDLTIGENGDLEGVRNFDTAIVLTVLSERRASESEVIVNSLRRGWWGNTLADIPDFEMGSKLWLLSQSRKTANELNLALTYSQNAFNWMIVQGFAQSVDVTGEITATGIRVKIDIKVSQSNVDTPSFDLWLGTGLNITGSV